MPPPYRPRRQPRISVRYPFDYSFPPNPTTPVYFVADGNAGPPGGSGFTVEGQLFDLAGTTPQSNKLLVSLTQGLWTMGPFTDPMGNPLAAGSYLLVARLLQGVVERDVDVITIELV